MNTSFSKPAKKTSLIGYFGILIIPFVTFLLGMTVGYNQAKHDIVNNNINGISVVRTAPPSDIVSGNKAVDLSLFWDVWEKLEDLYVDNAKLDAQSMIYGAIRGMVVSLDDPYTIFMDPKESEEFRNSLSGDLEGIGAELSIKENHLVIVSPLKNSPAEKAGLKPGDIIYKINDDLSTNMTLPEAVSKIRGKKGTTVALVIVRKGIEDPLEFTITREEIKVSSVSWEVKEGNIAYISINQFGDDTSKEFKNAVNDILLKKIKGIILDLRFNGGGYLDGAVDIVSEFIMSGTATTIKRRGEQEEIQTVSGHARLSQYPLVVLINEGSASASEIVAGAIKDYGQGFLMGEKSFGKGTVQELQPLSDGSSLRITIAKWYTPRNVNVDGIGIQPDNVVKNIEDAEETDEQLEEAITYLQKKIR